MKNNEIGKECVTKRDGQTFDWQQRDDDLWITETEEFGTVTLQCVDDGDGDEFEEWDICIDGCWQGPFSTEYDCIQHLKACVKEARGE